MVGTRGNANREDLWGGEDFPVLGTDHLTPNLQRASPLISVVETEMQEPTTPSPTVAIDSSELMMEMMKQQQIMQQQQQMHQQRQQQQQQTLIEKMSEQIASPSAEVAASKTEDSPLPSTPTKNKGAEAELERRRNLRYVPESLDNPFPTRPKNLDSDMPQMYAMYEDKSYDSLNKKSASSMKYEYAVLAPALSYFHVFHKHTVIELDDLEKNDLYNRLVCLENSLNGVYTLLCSLFSILQLRASIDGEGVSKTDADSLRAKLKFVEDCVYSGTEGLVTDTLLKEYLAEFDKGKNKAAMYANMKHAALGRRGTRELEVGGVGATTRRSKVPLEERTRAKVAASHRAELRLKARDVLGTPLSGASASGRRTERLHYSRESAGQKGGLARGGR
ncbi:hypothetical protein CYMTET_24561 [Cymbomonas tetramitiformis]|uniref:Uncharacterized protein n=1 Tax=Cymbomonas tetramitiformis TaxID=36881 RepID=A0AAE0FX02_9CHLO|nr:hypothetical protein CYMTET_24561 [Cymbomonas tetramitiformis]